MGEKELTVLSVGAGPSVLVGFLTWILRSVVVGWVVVLLWEVAIAESLQRRRLGLLLGLQSTV